MAVEEKVKQIIVEQLQVDEAEVTPGASFQEDLGADSLDVVELVMQFEEAFDLEIPDEDAEKIKTVKDAIDYIEKNAKGRERQVAGANSKSRDHRPRAGVRCGQHRTRGVAATWRAPAAWRRSQGFDTTGFPVTFAAEVKNFDPLNFVDKKEARKMGRFIHFAFAAAQEAMAQSGLQDHRRKTATASASSSARASADSKSSSASTPTCCTAARARYRPSSFPRPS